MMAPTVGTHNSFCICPICGERKSKNPGAVAAATGAELKSTRSYDYFQNTPRERICHWSRTCLSLEFALTLGDADAWRGFAFVASARLSKAERVALAFWTLGSLDHNTAYLTASAALFGLGDEVAA